MSRTRQPDFQNIPIKSELGRKIRELFIPTDDKHEVDYSEIEKYLLELLGR